MMNIEAENKIFSLFLSQALQADRDLKGVTNIRGVKVSKESRVKSKLAGDALFDICIIINLIGMSF